MVRTYIRKTSRQSWSTEFMNQAVNAVISGEMGYVAASNRYEVPSSTLERYVRKKRENPEAVVDKTSGKYHTVFTPGQEIELVNYVKDMQNHLFGITMKEFRRLAYQLAEKNNSNHNFNKATEMAGEDWANGFLKRHRDLSLRKPEATSEARAMAFNKVAVSNFFTLLKEILDKHKIDATRIYNCDEARISVAQKKFSKIISNRGHRQLTAEKGTTVTAKISCSAAGSYMPPMLIFPLKKKQSEFEIGLPPGAWIEVNDSGWMTIELFLKWFQKFIRFSRATKDQPVILLLDGNASHRKNLAIIDLARENGVIILCFPPHCSHRLQPLDITFMKSLSLYYEDGIIKWLRSHPGKVVQLSYISELFGQAYLKIANIRTAIKGFEKTGIWPTDLNIFTDDDFLPTTTNIPLENHAERTKEEPTAPASAHQSIETLEDLSTSVVNTPGTVTPMEALLAEIPKDKPGCSWMEGPIANTKISNVSPKGIIPLPEVKTELEESVNKTKNIKEEKEERLKRKLTFKGKEKNPKRRKTKPKKQQMIVTESEESLEEDAACLDLYSKPGEDWCSCGVCKKWVHKACVGLDSDDDSAFICKQCQ